MDPRVCLDEVEKGKFLTLPVLELRYLGRPALIDYTIPSPLLKIEMMK
jgi:hypothetical protein